MRADRSLLPAVIEETLRWETSVTQVSRVAAVDADVGGCPIPKGAAVSVITGSANHDETRYEHADQFDIDRPIPEPSGVRLRGSTSASACTWRGSSCAPALGLILDRLPSLRLDPDEAPPVVAGLAFRGPDQLPVLFDAA